jgi:hypothetical protein
MSTRSATRNGVVAPDDLLVILKDLIVTRGETELARRLDVSRSALLRMLAGVRVRKGTVAQVRANIAAMRLL